MDSYTSLLDAFADLNQRKRSDPDALTDAEREDWKSMRRRIEQALFERAADAAHDTREFLRVPVSLSARYWTRNELRDRYIPVLGEGGLQISTVDPLPVGTRLDLEIQLAHRGLSIAVQGEVVWSVAGEDPAGRGMGIRFVELSYEQKRAIYELVDDTLRERLLERRRFARIEARLQVQFVYADAFFELETDDLSLGGLFIATEQLLPQGERLRLVLHVTGERPAIKAVAEVVRRVERPAAGRPRGIGVRFVELDAEDRRVLLDYLQQRVTEQQRASVAAERRLHPRMEHRIKLRYQSNGALGARFSRDISTGGVFIQTHEAAPPVGAAIEVDLIHPVTLHRLQLAGRVVRVVEPDERDPARVPGVGVKFDPLPAERQAALDDLLRYFVELEHAPDEAGGGPAPEEPA